MTERFKFDMFENAYIYKQKNTKNWTLDYRDIQGNRIRKSAKTSDKREALRKLNSILSVIEMQKEGDYIFATVNKKSIIKIIDNLIQIEEKRKPTEYKRLSWNEYNLKETHYIRRFEKLKEHLKNKGVVHLQDFKTKEIRDFLDQNFSKTELGYRLIIINKIFDYATENNLIENRPAIPKNIQYKKPKKKTSIPKEKMEYFFDYLEEVSSHYEMQSELKKVDNKPNKLDKRIHWLYEALLTYCLILRTTGMRTSEAEAIKLENFTIKDNEVFLYITESKTEDRTIAVSRDIYNRVAPFARYFKRKKNDYIFKNPYSNSKRQKPFHEVFTKIKRDPDKLKLPEVIHSYGFTPKQFKEQILDFGLYQFRNTYITERLLENVEITKLAQHCGTSIKMIQKSYSDIINLSEKRLIQNTDKVKQAFQGEDPDFLLFDKDFD